MVKYWVVVRCSDNQPVPPVEETGDEDAAMVFRTEQGAKAMADKMTEEYETPSKAVPLGTERPNTGVRLVR